MNEKPDKLHPCPCDPAARCRMDEPCIGCETYSEWCNKVNIPMMAEVNEKKQRFFSMISDQVMERYLKGTPITEKESNEIVVNGYEKRLLLPLVDNKALISMTKNALEHEDKLEMAKFSIPKSYMEAILHMYIWELIRRLENK